MAEIRVPRWMIAQICMPSGVRQGKRPELPKLATEYHFPKRLNTCGREIFIPKEAKGVFEGWEYRYWAANFDAAEHGSPVCECRACGFVPMPGLDNRRKHFQEAKCTKILHAAYELLRRDNRCVICNNYTVLRKWSVPICDDKCEEVWCTEDASPSALAMAVALVVRQGGK